MNGHSSRVWKFVAGSVQIYIIEVIQEPANTSHCLQPCDQTINKRFKQTIRKARDDLCSAIPADTKEVQFKLMCAIVDHGMISTYDIRSSFPETGLFLLSLDF